MFFCPKKKATTRSEECLPSFQAQVSKVIPAKQQQLYMKRINQSMISNIQNQYAKFLYRMTLNC